jgi:PAS domain S-box-containing protein
MKEIRLDIFRSLSSIGDKFNNPITVVNLDLDDDPLVYVNQQFCQMTGYDAQQILGKNCRFLQGPETDRDVVSRIGQAIAKGEPIWQDLLNYRADGSTFKNRLVLFPLSFNDEHYCVGMQHLVTEEQAKLVPDEKRPDQADISHIIGNSLAALFSTLSAIENHPDYRERLESSLIKTLAEISDFVATGARGANVVPARR